MDMESNLFTLRLSKFERQKYDNFLSSSEFKSLAELIREATNVYISNPAVRNPVREPTPLEEKLKGFDRYMERRRKEEDELISLVQENKTRIEIIGNIVNLLAESAGISKRELKKAKQKDTSMEDIFDD